MFDELSRLEKLLTEKYVKVVQRDRYIATQFMQTFLAGSQSCIREQSCESNFPFSFPMMCVHRNISTRSHWCTACQMNIQLTFHKSS